MKWILSLFVLWSTMAHAVDPPTCPTDEEMLEPTAYLKLLSLDLRGVVPTIEEYEQVVALGDVPEEWIDQWISEEPFVERIVRFHKDLLWNNVSDTSLLSAAFRFRTTNGVYWRTAPSDDYRGQTTYCGDFEATMDYSEDEEFGYPVPVELEDGTLQEGWVWVSPYWDPENPIRVCAYDAQQREYSPTGTRCDSTDAPADTDCGCGPDLRWCALSNTHLKVSEGFTKDLDLRVADNIREDRSYVDLLTGRYGYVNGPMVDYLKHRRDVPATIRLTESPYDIEGLPDLSFTDEENWQRIDLGENHSGILTSPAFLLRFQTNRARSDKFYNAFLCQPFQAPETGLEGLEDATATLDLTARPGCNGCHALLEPAAAYWGRWTEQGAGFLDEALFPPFEESCERCVTEGYTCSDVCRRYYLSDLIANEQLPYLGMLNSYVFLDDEHREHVAEGPELLVKKALGDGRLGQCVSKRAVQHFLSRDLRAEESEWVDALMIDFVASGYRYKTLVKAIVTSDSYRRVR